MAINASNYEACIARIAARGSIGQREAENLLEAVAEAGDRMRQTGVDDPFVTAAWQLARDLREQAEIKKVDAARNASIRVDLIDGATKDGTIKGAINHLRGTLFWLAGQENKENVQTLWHGLSNQWNSVLFAKLRKDGLLEAARDPAMFAPVAKEIFELRSIGPNLPDASPARRIAELVMENQEAQRARLNNEGARISQAVDWIATTSHDPYLMRRGGKTGERTVTADDAFQRWWAFVKDRLDDRTFDDVKMPDTIPAGMTPDQALAAAREDFGHKVFNAIYDNVHMHTGATEGASFEGGGYNLARKLSQGRTLLWKDGESWAEYMSEYGRSNNWLKLAVDSGDVAAKKAALMKYFGTNPANNLRLVMRNIAERFRDKDPDGVKAFLEQGKAGLITEDIREVMKLLDGTSEKPANQMAAEIGRTARNVSNMAFLGGVQLTHFASLLTTLPSDALMHGDSIFSTLGTMVKSMFTSLKAEERVDFLADLGAFGDGLKRHVEDHFGHGYTVPGVVSQANNYFMTATGLPYVFEHAQAGRKSMLAAKYARAVDKPFDQLHPAEQKLLQSYAIGPEEWALLKTGQLSESEGTKYLTPNIAASMGSGDIEALLTSRGTLKAGASPEATAKAVDAFRSDLSDRLTMLYQDAAHLGVVGGGVRERALLKGRSTPGTVTDELLSAVTQFHAWPVAAVYQIMARQLYDTASKGQAAWNIGILAGLTLMGGYLRTMVRDLSNGLPPSEPRNIGEAVKFAGYWMSQGGMTGILGDWIGGELNRSPSTEAAGALGGPLVGMAAGIGNILRTLAQEVGSEKHIDMWPQITRQLAGHIPFANLIYLRGALDYLMLWHAFEAMKPGWWQRSNSMMQKEQGRTHFGFRPYQPVPYSPF